jgi:hypothetical protein
MKNVIIVDVYEMGRYCGFFAKKSQGETSDRILIGVLNNLNLSGCAVGMKFKIRK